MSKDIRAGAPKAGAAAKSTLDREAAAQRRLADALRANLRRRKAAAGGNVPGHDVASPQPAASGTDKDGNKG